MTHPMPPLTEVTKQKAVGNVTRFRTAVYIGLASFAELADYYSAFSGNKTRTADIIMYCDIIKSGKPLNETSFVQFMSLIDVGEFCL